MQVQEHVNLQPHHTFGLAVQARYFAVVRSVAQLQALMQTEVWRTQPRLFLGGGSNVLFRGDVDGLVVKMGIRGIEALREDEHHVWLRVGAGENWHGFVQYCIGNGLAGLENLSLIPGTVGAAPMQNIGAYGVEQEACFEELAAVELTTGEVHTFDHAACGFGYRESIFKHQARDRYLITSVTYRLNKEPTFHTEYGAIQDTLAARGITELSLRAVSEAVIAIRQSKLPDPTQVGNAGSFFKNPVITAEQFATLQAAHPEVPHYPLPDGQVKVPAGWLIEQAGWKGQRRGPIGVHDRQALVLVNHGGGHGADLWQLAQDIQASVAKKFGVAISPEVNVVG